MSALSHTSYPGSISQTFTAQIPHWHALLGAACVSDVSADANCNGLLTELLSLCAE